MKNISTSHGQVSEIQAQQLIQSPGATHPFGKSLGRRQLHAQQQQRLNSLLRNITTNHLITSTG
jgi:hypothetical protein